MSMENKNLTDLTPAPRILPVTRNTALPERAHAQEAATVDFYAVAASSFQIHLDWIEQQGRKDTPDWHQANGLLQLAQGLQQDHEAQAERVKSFARSCPASEIEGVSLATDAEHKRS